MNARYNFKFIVTVDLCSFVANPSTACSFLFSPYFYLFACLYTTPTAPTGLQTSLPAYHPPPYHCTLAHKMKEIAAKVTFLHVLHSIGVTCNFTLLKRYPALYFIMQGGTPSSFTWIPLCEK